MSETPTALTDHLTELRKRLIYTIIIIATGAAICFSFSEELFILVRAPVAKYLTSGGLVYTGIMDKFNAHVRLACLGGVILTAPLWLYQVWMFIAPGLYRRERKYAAGFLLSGTFLFLLGVVFCYTLVYPMAFDWLFTFGGTTDKPMITIEEYMSFFGMTIILFGVSFELPLVMVILGMLGLIDKEFLRTKRRYAYVMLAVVAGILTPPDLMSQILMLTPLCLLYELSIWLVAYFAPKPTLT